MHYTKVIAIYTKTDNQRTVQILLGLSKLKSVQSNPGSNNDDTSITSEGVEI
jgi:hypothetical protein